MWPQVTVIYIAYFFPVQSLIDVTIVLHSNYVIHCEAVYSSNLYYLYRNNNNNNTNIFKAPFNTITKGLYKIKYCTSYTR